MIRRDMIVSVIVQGIVMFPLLCLLGHWGIAFSEPGHAGEWSRGAIRGAFNFCAIWIIVGLILELSGLNKKFAVWGTGDPTGR